jgi:hypothetical protein
MLETHLSYIKDIADTVLNEESNDINRDGAWPKATFDALKDAGVMGLTIPTQYNGLGGGVSSLSKAAYYLGFYSGSAGLCFSMHCAVIAEKPTPTHIDAYLTLFQHQTNRHRYWARSYIKLSRALGWQYRSSAIGKGCLFFYILSCLNNIKHLILTDKLLTAETCFIHGTQL